MTNLIIYWEYNMDNKDLIRQYVNIGIRLLEYQLNRLSVNDLRTYLRVRIIMVIMVIILILLSYYPNEYIK
jgi:hypothetical protein